MNINGGGNNVACKNMKEEGGTGEGKEVVAAREEEGNPRRARTPRGVE